MQITLIIFFILTIIYFSFGAALFVSGKLLNKKGLSFLQLFFLLYGFLCLAPAVLLFNTEITFSAYYTGPFKVSLAPLTYLYFKKLAVTEKTINRKDIIHFIPLFLMVILVIIVAPGNTEKVAITNQLVTKKALSAYYEGNFYYNVLALSTRVIIFSQGIIYAYLIYNLYKKYASVLMEEVSLISQRNLFWIRWAALLLVFEGIFQGLNLFGIYSNPLIFILHFVFLIFYAFYFLFHSIMQEDISFIETPSQKHDEESTTGDNTNTSGIIELFNETELYLNPQITIQDAANQLNIAKYKLSQIIKENGYSNFYSFVNEQRVNYSKKLLI
ncbi:MAG: hypothetical protein PVH88_20260 [Ignavibacteria bacterium]|jgi:AraC-like DNA-binding protein